MVTKQVRERLEAFENRKKVLMLGKCEEECSEKLSSMFESSGYMLCDIEMFSKDRNIDDYEFIVIPKGKFKELLANVKDSPEAPAAEQPEKIGAAAACRLDKRIVTEQDIQKLIRAGCTEAVVGKKTIITPLALDSIKVGRIRLIRE
jgi:hypothetical protein